MINILSNLYFYRLSDGRVVVERILPARESGFIGKDIVPVKRIFFLKDELQNMNAEVFLLEIQDRFNIVEVEMESRERIKDRRILFEVTMF